MAKNHILPTKRWWLIWDVFLFIAKFTQESSSWTNDHWSRPFVRSTLTQHFETSILFLGNYIRLVVITYIHHGYFRWKQKWPRPTFFPSARKRASFLEKRSPKDKPTPKGPLCQSPYFGKMNGNRTHRTGYQRFVRI